MGMPHAGALLNVSRPSVDDNAMKCTFLNCLRLSFRCWRGVGPSPPWLSYPKLVVATRTSTMLWTAFLTKS